MKHLIVIILLLVCGTAYCGPAESTVQVCEKKMGFFPVMAGTGFTYSNGYVLTAKHVVDGNALLQIRDYAGRMHECVVVSTGSPDWACIYAPTLNVPLFKVRTEPLVQGEPVTAYGDFRGVVGKLESTTGIIKNSVWQRDCQNFTGNVRPGYSGGPVVDRNSCIVGITSWENNITGDSGFVRITDVFRGR